MDRNHLATLGMSSKGSINDTFSLGKVPVDDREIALFNTPGFELFGQRFMSQIVLGRNDDSGCKLVQTVDNAWTQDSIDS